MSQLRQTDRRRNILRAVHFQRPDYIPMIFHINESSWHHYPAAVLEDLIESHPFLFPGRDKSSARTELDYVIPERAGKPFTDGWGCLWQTTMDGIVGTVTHHPLADWRDFDAYRAPDPEVDSGKGPIDWQAVASGIEAAKLAGQLASGGLRHGHTFQTLVDIRSYENLLFDMADGEPRLDRLIEMVSDFNLAIVRRYIAAGAEWMSYPEDLGMQNGPMISPAYFRRYIKPVYARLIAPAQEAGCIVHMHSDGYIGDLIDDILDAGVHVMNLQDLVNGIDWIRDKLAGKICIDLDIDRQHITPRASVRQIDSLIREEVEKLGSPKGGLMMIYGLYPGVRLENIKALADAMERYATYYS